MLSLRMILHGKGFMIGHLMILASIPSPEGKSLNLNAGTPPGLIPHLLQCITINQF
jgi:hypothetical protein